MSFCKNCGKELKDNARFCAACGTPVSEEGTAQQQAQPQQSQAGQNFTQNIAQLNNTADYTSQIDPKDAEANKVFAILAYIGILVLVTIFGAPKNSKFARFHANQGLVLLIAEAVYGIFSGIISGIIRAIVPDYQFVFGGAGAAVYGIVSVLLSLISIVFLVFAIIGIVNAATGKAKELPIIGKIKILK